MGPPDRAEILSRLQLIDDMMAEGRRATERWGWSFLLWGIGPLLAMWWEAHCPHPLLAWPVVILLCVLVNGAVLQARKRRGAVETAVTRSVGAVWTSAGVTVLILALGAACAGASDARTLYVALFALAAAAHCASSVILRWVPQFLAALVWLSASLAAFIVPSTSLKTLAAGALLLGNVAFGLWLAYRERSRRDA